MFATVPGMFEADTQNLVVNLLDFSPVDPTGVQESTQGFINAIAALPTVTVYATPSNSTGASATYHRGTILIPAGTYKLGVTKDIGNIGPFVSLLGVGHNAVKLDYRGSGDCLRMFNAVLPSSNTFDTLAVWAGKIDGFTIDGTNAAAGACGFHYGDMPGGRLGDDLYISNFSGASSIGWHCDNTVSWVENTKGKLVIYNCTSAVVFDVTASGSTTFAQCDLEFNVFCFANQSGVILQNGAIYEDGAMCIRGSFANSNAANSSVCLTITGSNAGIYSQFSYVRLEIFAESDLSGTQHPQTIKFGNVSNNAIYNCFGLLTFVGSWATTNWSVANSFASGNFTFMGQLFGDSNLTPTAGGGLFALGPFIFGLSEGFNNGVLAMAQGDFFAFTLSASVTISFQTNAGGPQRKTIAITQAHTGGPYTVTWPKPGSPTVTSPAVYWAAGSAPTMTATADAIDIYYLETLDGIKWYGRTTQNMS